MVVHDTEGMKPNVFIDTFMIQALLNASKEQLLKLGQFESMLRVMELPNLVNCSRVSGQNESSWESHGVAVCEDCAMGSLSPETHPRRPTWGGCEGGVINLKGCVEPVT